MTVTDNSQGSLSPPFLSSSSLHFSFTLSPSSSFSVALTTYPCLPVFTRVSACLSSLPASDDGRAKFALVLEAIDRLSSPLTPAAMKAGDYSHTLDTLQEQLTKVGMWTRVTSCDGWHVRRQRE